MYFLGRQRSRGAPTGDESGGGCGLRLLFWGGRFKQVLCAISRSWRDDGSEVPMHNLANTIALIERTPSAFSSLLRDLPEEWTRRNEGEKTWSAFDVVGHLIHCDRDDWMKRVRWVLERGDSEPFPAFDRWGHVRACEGKSMAEVLDELISVRAESVAGLRALQLTEEDLARRGLHPGLGGVTISELLATWAAHDLNHLHQISRVMAHQY